jgi:hypothetical protein
LLQVFSAATYAPSVIPHELDIKIFCANSGDNMNNYFFAIFSVLSPILAVLISIYFQRRYSSYDARHKLFISLMINRQPSNPTIDWINSLNSIDIVFSDYPKVLSAWKDLFQTFEASQLNPDQVNRYTVALLDEMAKSLGYTSLRQLDIQKFYIPN